MLLRVYQKLQSVLSAHVKRVQATSTRLAGKILKLDTKETLETAWHRKYVSPMLIKHYHEFTSGRRNRRILVPLCGKSLDMIWLADQGHTVFGVEMIRKAIETFFEEKKITIRRKHRAYFSRGYLILIECSIFDLSREVYHNKFDCIWDRGACTVITVMNEARLRQYVDVLLTSLQSDERYFVRTFRCESGKNEGEWVSHLPEDKLLELYGDRCEVGLVEQDNIKNDPALLETYATAPQQSIFYYFVTLK